jgi:hypothetical protein
MDMCLHLENPTARKIWLHLADLFTGNKSSRAVHLEYELHNLIQGEMCANDYCHRLNQLANSLANCDAPVSDRALVHQLIRSLNAKFSVLKTLLTLLPKFPSFVEARELILMEEASHEVDNKRTTKTAVLAASAASQKVDSSAPPPPAPDCANNNNTGANNTNTFYGSRGRGRSRAAGRGNRNGWRGGSGCNFNNNNAPQWPSSNNWGCSGIMPVVHLGLVPLVRDCWDPGH